MGRHLKSSYLHMLFSLFWKGFFFPIGFLLFSTYDNLFWICFLCFLFLFTTFHLGGLSQLSTIVNSHNLVVIYPTSIVSSYSQLSFLNVGSLPICYIEGFLLYFKSKDIINQAIFSFVEGFSKLQRVLTYDVFPTSTKLTNSSDEKSLF
jgi:hypothetical protein